MAARGMGLVLMEPDEFFSDHRRYHERAHAHGLLFVVSLFLWTALILGALALVRIVWGL